jgi:hypothetical protein
MGKVFSWVVGYNQVGLRLITHGRSRGLGTARMLL